MKKVYVKPVLLNRGAIAAITASVNAAGPFSPVTKPG
jgi:hypothetical protein